MADSDHTIWKSFCTALGAEYREAKEIHGNSGMVHPVQAIAVDEVKKRIIVVSAEYNPRIAALMRIDIQSTLPDMKVLVARPLAVDLAHTARVVFNNSNGGLDYNKILQTVALFSQGAAAQNQINDAFGRDLAPIIDAMKRSGLPVKSHFLHTVEQAVAINWAALKAQGHHEAFPLLIEAVKMFRNRDNLAEDRQHGICPVPTYELTDTDWELFLSGSRLDDIKERLRALNILQYFFPPADSVALAMVDNGYGTPADIIKAMHMAEKDGHELAENEMLPGVRDVPDMLSEFASIGYIAEGEETYEITTVGETVRRTIKYRPREGLIERIISRFNFNISLDFKDLLKSGDGDNTS